MQAHTAQHMIAGLFFSMYSIGTLAIHLADSFLTVELDAPEIPLEKILAVEDSLNREILAGRGVTCRTVSHEEAVEQGLRRPIKVSGPVRLVSIASVDLIACGGLHVASACEIGSITYEGSESIRGHVRTIWHYGENAVSTRRLEHRTLKEAAVLLSCQSDEVPAAVTRLVSELRSKESGLRAKDELVAGMLLSTSGKAFVSPVPVAAYQKLCREEGSFFTAHDEGGSCKWLLNADKAVFEKLRGQDSCLGVKGGGRGRLYQGSATCTATALVECARRILDA